MNMQYKQGKHARSTHRDSGFAFTLALAVVSALIVLATVAVVALWQASAEAQELNSGVSVQAQESSHDAADTEESSSSEAADDSHSQESADSEESASSESSEEEESASSESSADDSDDAADAGDDSSNASEDAQSESAESADASDKSSDSSKKSAKSKDAEKRTLETTIKTSDGKRYTVLVTFGAKANIPESAKLKVVRVMQTPEGYDPDKSEWKGRPTDEEHFVSAKQIAERGGKLYGAVDVQDGDYVFYTEYLDISIVSDGKVIQPDAGIEVTIETDAVDQSASDAIEASFFDRVPRGAEYANAIKLDNCSGDKYQGDAKKADREDVKAYKKGSKVTFKTDELSELGFAGVAVPHLTEQVRGSNVTVLGPAGTSVWTTDAWVDEDTLPTGTELAAAYGFGVDPACSYGTRLWVEAKAASTDVADAGHLEGYLIEGGSLGKKLFGAKGTSKPVAVERDDAIALVWVPAEGDDADAVSDAAADAGEKDGASDASSTEGDTADGAKGTVDDTTVVEPTVSEADDAKADPFADYIATRDSRLLSLGLGMTAQAADDIANGTWENGTANSGTWVINANGVMTIAKDADRGGKMKDYTKNNVWVKDTPWFPYIDPTSSNLKVTKLVIENGITRIGTNSFTRAYKITEVDASNCGTLESIGESILKMTGNPSGTSMLVRINFSGNTNLTTIEQDAFSTCKNLKYVDFSNTALSSVHQNAFVNCTAIEEIDISGTKLTNVAGTFSACTNSLKVLTYKNGTVVTTANLSSYNNLQTVDMSDCTNLTSVTLPNSVVEVDFSGCTKLTSLNLTGKTELTTLSLPTSITQLTGMNDCTKLNTINYEGTRAEFNQLCRNNNVTTLPDGITVNCQPASKSTDLNAFADAESMYFVAGSAEELPITRPAIVNSPNDVFSMKLHFSDIPDVGTNNPRILDIDENTALIYKLPDGVNIVLDEDGEFTTTVTVSSSGTEFIGKVTYEAEGNQLKLEWNSFADHNDEEVEAFKNDQNISFFMTVPVTIASALPAAINFGKEGNSVVLQADGPHNPRVVSKTVGRYNVAEKTVSYNVVVTAQGNVDNGGNPYPVVINDEMGQALSFNSGTVSYVQGSGYQTGDPQTTVKGANGATVCNAPANAVSFSGFPVTVEHMYDGDTIAFNYTVSVDTAKIAINGSPTFEEAGNRVQLENEDNLYNNTEDDTNPGICIADIVFPEMVKTLEDVDTASGDYPVYKFSTYVSGLQDSDLNDEGQLVVEDTFAETSDYAKLWQLCDSDGYEAKAYHLNWLNDELDDEKAVSLTTAKSEGGATFTLANVKNNGDDFWNFYKVVYYITPKDDAAVAELKRLAAIDVKAGETVGEQTFTNSTNVTSGNSTFSATSQYTYSYLPIKKTLTSVDGNWAFYQIDVNPDKMRLNNGVEMQLKDKFFLDMYKADGVTYTEEYQEMISRYPNYVAQSIDYYSIETTSSSEVPVTYDFSNYTGTYVIPDETTVTIQYRTRVDGEPGSEVTFRNDAILGDKYEASLTTTRVIYPGSDDVEPVSENYIKLFKYEEGHMEEGLAGARFLLLDANQQPMTYQRGGEDKVGTEIIFETEDGSRELKKGYASISLSEEEDGVTLKKNTVYYLEEVKAPVKEVDGTYTYYKKDSTLYSFVISDNPDYDAGGVYTFFNGDVLKVRNYKEEKGIFVNKRFTGNVSLTQDQKNSISFVLKKKVENPGEGEDEWETVKSINGTDEDKIDYDGNTFRYGYAQFKTNNDKDGSFNDLQEGATYGVFEEGADVDGYNRNTNWIVTQVGEDGAISEDTIPTKGDHVEFTVNQYNKNHCIDILCDNKYSQNKLSIKSVDADDGAALNGATFSIFNSSDQLITSKTTGGNDGNGIAVIAYERMFSYNTLYYAKETAAPTGYMLPNDPEKFYFYFTDPNASADADPWRPTGLPTGAKAIDLTTSYTSVTVENGKSTVEVPVLKVWDIGGQNNWPDGIDHVVVGLYRSVNGSEEVPVTNDDGENRVVSLTEENPYSNALSQPALAAVDAAGNRINYSVRELGVYDDAEETTNLIDDYAHSYSTTDSGVYVIRNAEGVKLHVVKEWYDSDNQKITDPDKLSEKQDISFDIYRSVSELKNGEGASYELTREEIEEKLADPASDLECVQAGVVVGDAGGWETTVGSLKKYDADRNEYKYFVLETKNKDLEDKYQVTKATETSARQVTIQNSGSVQPICKIEGEAFFTLKDAMQYASDHDISDVTIEMLVDYIMPLTDALEIPNGYNVTLTTASTDDELYPFKPSDDEPDRDRAIITRYATFTDEPMFTVHGALSFQNIILDGDNVATRQAMIDNYGTLEIGLGAVLQNASNSGSGGAVYSSGVKVTVAGGTLQNNTANRGGAIYVAAGDVEIKSQADSGGDHKGTLSNNSAYQGGAIYFGGSGSIDVGNTTLQGNEAVDGGSGGAIYAVGGTVTVNSDAEFTGNSSELGSGGAIYTTSGVVSVEGGSFTSNQAWQSGGAIGTSGGSITVSSGEFSANTAVVGSGGALYSNIGTITVSGGSMTGNIAGSYGGAISSSSGTINLSGGSLGNVADPSKANKAINGAAVYVAAGIANFSGDVAIKGNLASNGGAVGVGGLSARLYFSESVLVSDNKIGATWDAGVTSNVYLDQNSDAIINAAGLGNTAAIGIYVPDNAVTVNGESTTLLNLRGVPGTKFASYTSDAQVDKFTNDRLTVKVVPEATSKKLLWGKDITVEVRYLSSYKTIVPSKENGTWKGTLKYGPVSYSPKMTEGAVSLLAEDMYKDFKKQVGATAAFGGAYADIATEAYVDFMDYLETIEWDSSRVDPSSGEKGAWKFTKHGDGSVYCNKIVLYYAEPAYISIENNTNLAEGSEGSTFTITDLTVGSWTAINGYGYLVSKNGGTQRALLPLQTSDCVLGPGGSIKLMIPGGCDTPYTLKGSFQDYPGNDIRVIHTKAEEEGDYDDDQVELSTIQDPGLSYKTLAATGKTHEVIFQTTKPVCKIVYKEPLIVYDPLVDKVVKAVQDGNKYEYLFASIKNAVEFAKKYELTVPVNNGEDETTPEDGEGGTTPEDGEGGTTPEDGEGEATEVPGAVIEMLVDYPLISADKVVLPTASNYTFKTARTGVFVYSGSNEHAVISRDSGNKNSFIEVSGKKANTVVTSLTISDLGLDGKNLGGDNDGGAVMTWNCAVTLDNVVFQNFVALNGGAVYALYADKSKADYYYDEDFNPAKLSASNVTFSNCESSSNTNRQGGGAIWTNAKELDLNSCDFTGCVADDQGGAVFHRIDAYVPGTMTTVASCTFIGSEARAAGAIETDAGAVVLTGCTFTDCIATQRNGGAVNVYSNNKATTTDPSSVAVTGCTFTNCHADGGVNEQPAHGGGLRSAALQTTVTDCTFVNCSSLRGGGIAISNSNAGTTATISECSVSDSNALYLANSKDNIASSGRGGGVYCMAKQFTMNDSSVTNCISGQEGGAVYHEGETLEMNDCTITGSTSGTAGTEKKAGGGVCTTASVSATVTGCTIRDNTAAGDGGGLYHSAANGRLTVDACVLTGNTSGNRGGGVYTASHMTLCNDSYIMSNQLSGDEASNAAGVWLNNNRWLTIGTAERAQAGMSDASTIKDNYTAGGKPSNLRLSMNGAVNHTSSVSVLCNLSGEIGVVNAAKKKTQFGSSAIDSPEGFTDLKHVFVADDGTLYGILDRSNSKRIIWSGQPICKITDENGNILHFKDGSSAIFDALDVGDRSKTDSNSAFALLRNASPELYTDTSGQSKYTGKTFYVKMLVEEYVVEKYITSNVISGGRTVILTTAGLTDGDGYTYQGSAGTSAKIMRGSALPADANMLTARYNMTLQNITLDGGSQNGVTAGKDTRIFVVDDKSAAVTIGTNAVLQNAIVSGRNEKSTPWTYSSGAGVWVMNGSLTLAGGTIQNCTSVNGNGGGIRFDNNGTLTISSGSTIRNCKAANGGGVYKTGTGNLTMNGGSITNCRAIANGEDVEEENANVGSGNGGGVYVAAGSFEMNGGSITSCGYNTSRTPVTKRGGGVFVADATTMTMSGGKIQANTATDGGCGIAVGGETTTSTAKLYFSGSAYVYGNTLPNEDACNVELDKDSNNIINSTGLNKTATIGVYVPGVMDPASGLFALHGKRGDHFGKHTNSNNLRCFVNDRNNLRGGPDEDNPGTIRWIQIYFLRVSKQVLSDSAQDREKEFEFTVKLEGTGEDINGNPVEATSINNTSGQYGEIPFVAGVATIHLKSGESLTAENLPGGLTFTVTENLTDEEKEYFATIPVRDEAGNIRITGIVGQNANFLSKADFTNIHAVCKITCDTHGLLYYREGKKYEPAVYRTLSAAFSAINKSSSTPLYYYEEGSSTPKRYSGSYNVEMLIPSYSVPGAITLERGKTVTLTTAARNALDGYPYAGTGGVAVVSRGYTGASLLTTNGSLTLGKITLDGASDDYACTSHGGLVKVGAIAQTSGASLSIGENAVLRDSGGTGDGAAVYAFSGAGITLTGGTIQNNLCTGNGSGAGIYLANGSTLNISGKPAFSNNTVVKEGYASKLNGGEPYVDGEVEQDIYLAETSTLSNPSPATIVIEGDLTGEDGSIWVWASNENYYKTLKPFAIIGTTSLSDANNPKVFRNAQDDETTGNRTQEYLHGTIANETPLYISWNGTRGTRKVILRKVVEGTAGYQSVESTGTGESATPFFAICTDSKGERPLSGLDNLTSNASGVFFAGELDYGDYYVVEKNNGYTFKITIDEEPLPESVSPQQTS